MELVRSLGADAVIDYTEEDYTAGDQLFDLIVDLVGDRRLAEVRRPLRKGGTLVMVGGSGGRWFKGTDRWLRAMTLSPFTRHRLRPLIHADKREDLILIKAMIDSGKVTPVVSARYPLTRVKEAIGHFDGGHGTGKVVITV